MIGHTTENRNNNIGRDEFPFADHELTQTVEIDIIVDVEKRTCLVDQIAE